jgi:hypothetical protein
MNEGPSVSFLTSTPLCLTLDSTWAIHTRHMYSQGMMPQAICLELGKNQVLLRISTVTLSTSHTEEMP